MTVATDDDSVELVDFPPPEQAPAVESVSAGKKALELIQEQCVLIAVHARCWQGRHKMSNTEVRVDGHKVDDEVVGDPYWDLIPREWRRRLSRHGGKARRAVRKWSVPFVIKGLYFVPTAQAEQCLSEVDAVRQELLRDVRDFVHEYPTVLNEIRGKTGDNFSKIEKKLKTPAELPSSFDIEVFPLRVNVVEYLGVRAGSYLRQAKAAMAQTVNGLVEDIIAGPRQEVYEALQKLRQTLADPTRSVRQKSLDALVVKLNKLKGFGFLADDKVLDAIRSVENQVRSASPQVLNFKSEAAASLGKAILDAEKECETDESERRAVERVRKRVVSVD